MVACGYSKSMTLERGIIREMGHNVGHEMFNSMKL
jgi:hypothetical protein